MKPRSLPHPPSLRFFTLLLALVSLVGFSSCSDSGDGDSPSSPDDQSSAAPVDSKSISGHWLGFDREQDVKSIMLIIDKYESGGAGLFELMQPPAQPGGQSMLTISSAVLSVEPQGTGEYTVTVAGKDQWALKRDERGKLTVTREGGKPIPLRRVVARSWRKKDGSSIPGQYLYRTMHSWEVTLQDPFLGSTMELPLIELSQKDQQYILDVSGKKPPPK